MHQYRNLPAVAALLMLTLAAAADTVAGQSPCQGLNVSTLPARVVPGTLFIVQVRGTLPGATLTGTVAGEPLHFSAPASAQRSYAAAPIESTTVHAVLRCSTKARVDSLVVPIPLATPPYRTERLRVAPRFSAAPDSALTARLARESAQSARVSANAHLTPPLWTGAFSRPRTSRITSVFGTGRTFNGTVTSRHMGTDWAGAVGAPVQAMQRGVVRIVDQFHLGGNVVYVDHGSGLVTAYLHLSKQLVAVGDTVARGAIIGRVGATGRVTGPHLHIIARYGGVSVDPLSVLARVTAPD
jgi:murein DD-endopeptidase MepM/ murein hydrolase activator NlpD